MTVGLWDDPRQGPSAIFRWLCDRLGTSMVSSVMFRIFSCLEIKMVAQGKTTMHGSGTFTATGMGIRCWPRQWRPPTLLISPKPWTIIKWSIWEPEGPHWLFGGLIGWLSVFCPVSAPISRPVREKTRRTWKVSWTGNSIGKMRSAPSHSLAILINIKGTSIFVCEYCVTACVISYVGES